MDNLITVITRFQLPAGVTPDQIRAAFEEAAPGFRNVPGLIRKQFLRSKDCRTAGGVYLWNDECAARAFMNDRTDDPPEVSCRSCHRILRFACDRGELNAKPPDLDFIIANHPSRLRRFVPADMFDKSVRKQFQPARFCERNSKSASLNSIPVVWSL